MYNWIYESRLPYWKGLNVHSNYYTAALLICSPTQNEVKKMTSCYLLDVNALELELSNNAKVPDL